MYCIVGSVDGNIFGMESKVSRATWIHNQTGISMLSSGIGGASSGYEIEGAIVAFTMDDTTSYRPERDLNR